ncbi:Uncharacterised protein [Mycobacterium tuberculosis]|nr:Uncharacterised protein [Mycobacterium tuberculosis]
MFGLVGPGDVPVMRTGPSTDQWPKCGQTSQSWLQLLEDWQIFH